jgi:hypothetical protein
MYMSPDNNRKILMIKELGPPIHQLHIKACTQRTYLLSLLIKLLVPLFQLLFFKHLFNGIFQILFSVNLDINLINMYCKEMPNSVSNGRLKTKQKAFDMHLLCTCWDADMLDQSICICRQKNIENIDD